MKQNIIKKYGLMIVLMFIGLFMIDMKTEAKDYADLICHYNFVYTQNDASGSKDYDLSFDLAYRNGIWEMDDENSPGVLSTISLDSGNERFRNFGTATACPEVNIYKRIGVRSFYVINTELKYICDQLGKEKVEGYTCANILGSYQGTDVTSSQICSGDMQSKLKNNLDNKYSTIDSMYNNYNNTLLHKNINLADESNENTVNRKCKEIQNSANSYYEQLEKKFQEIVDAELASAMCSVNDDFYSTYNNRLETQKNSLITTGRAAYNRCVNSSGLSDSEKDKLKSDNNNYISSLIGDEEEIPANCGMLSEIMPYIEKVFDFIQILVPIALIVFGVLDFSGPVLSNDKEALNKATSKFIKRCIIAVIIFFVPIIVELLLNIYNDATGSNASTCGLGKIIINCWR